jgi:phosphatidylethanolamine-binding protein (PEBP) family uncharacterized protein
MPTNRIASTIAVVAVATLLGACGGGSTATQSAGVSSLTTTSSVAPSTTTSSTSTSTSTTASSATTSTASTSARHSKSINPGSTGGTAANSHSSSATKQPAGRFALASAAFPRGGQIPARYTCDGGNVSPPLQWSNVPAGTSQLLLLALSLTPGAQGGIRWAVGGIDPSLGGFAAGQLPSGAVAGRSSNGQTGWAGICPARGTPQAIIVLVYALRNPLHLAPGFNPTKVQSQLPGDTLGRGIVYGVFRRP